MATLQHYYLHSFDFCHKPVYFLPTVFYERAKSLEDPFCKGTPKEWLHPIKHHFGMLIKLKLVSADKAMVIYRR